MSQWLVLELGMTTDIDKDGLCIGMIKKEDILAGVFTIIVALGIIVAGVMVGALLDLSVVGKIISSVVGLLIAVVVMLFNVLYTQDIGETAVVRNLGGSVAGSTEDAGFHAKLPWQSVVKYDVRNNVVSFIADGTEDYFGGSANGPHVTINDNGGAQADIDVQVNYSIDPSIAEELYANYGTQESFVQKVVAVDVRAVPRNVAGQFTTLDILTNRGEFTAAIQDALSEKWEPLGLHVEQVTVQNVTYPQSITDKYASAQVAEVAQQEAKAKQDTARVEAETQKIKAQGEADANAVLTESLTPEVLQQQYNEALQTAAENGCLIVVPEGSQPIVGASK